MHTDNLLGQRFNWHHAAGVTRYQVDRPHRDVGYYECVAVRGVSGAHHGIGGIQVFSRCDIETALKAEESPDVERVAARLTALRKTLRSTPVPQIEATLDGVIGDLLGSALWRLSQATPETPRKSFKLDVSKEWCERMAQIEDGHEVGAGSQSIDLGPLKRPLEPLTGDLEADASPAKETPHDH